MAKKSRQAYKQAPWRRQIQSIGLSLLPVVTIAVIVSLYLVISAQAAEAGLEIMNLHYEEEEILRSIANLRTKLAWTTSYTQMHKRAEKLGLEDSPAGEIYYMSIDGYKGKNAVLISPPPGKEDRISTFIEESYNESLSEWFLETFFLSEVRSDGGGS